GFIFMAQAYQMPVGVAVLEGGCGGTLLKVQSLIIIKYTPVLALSKGNKVFVCVCVCALVCVLLCVCVCVCVCVWPHYGGELDGGCCWALERWTDSSLTLINKSRRSSKVQHHQGRHTKTHTHTTTNG